ncbi:hypothetical protein R6Q59_018926 [Mikania micrantha]
MEEIGGGPLLMGWENQLDLNSLPHVLSGGNYSSNPPIEIGPETNVEDTAWRIQQDQPQEDQVLIVETDKTIEAAGCVRIHLIGHENEVREAILEEDSQDKSLLSQSTSSIL